MKYGLIWFLGILGLVLSACGVAPTSWTPSVASHTPTLTQTATLAPTATPMPTATPTPTPLPGEWLSQAHAAQTVGDWEAAAAEYRQALAASAPDVRAAAALGLAQSLLAEGKTAEAAEWLEAALTESAPLTLTATAHLELAAIRLEEGYQVSATMHYSAVQRLYPVLTPYTAEWSGDAYAAIGDHAAALLAYQTALAQTELAAQRAFLGEKIGLSYTALGRPEEAIQAYDAVLDYARVPAYRARIMYQAADTALVFGNAEAGYQRMQAILAAYPGEYAAYQALVRLIDAGIPVDERLRGLVDYYAGAYDPAIQSFQRLIEGDPAHTGEPHYYAGLAYLETDNPTQALAQFDWIFNTHPGDAFWGHALMGRAQALAALGRTAEAVAAYQSLVEQQPDYTRAPEALWEAADLLSDDGKLTEAAAVYADLAERYPDDAGAPDARLRAGLLHYRRGDWAAAQQAWRDLLLWYPNGETTAAAHFWLGKSYLASGAPLSATAALSQAQALDPWDYYGLRAADLLQVRKPFAQSYAEPRACGSAAEQQAAEVWLAGWLGLGSAPTATLGLGELDAALRADPRLQRGTLLLRLGRFDEGRAELEALRQATLTDALAQYRLALHFRAIGLYRSSIIAAGTVWQLSPVFDIRELPRFLGCLIYPTDFAPLVEAEARERGFDPLLIDALIRQESLFEGFATSSAAAHGLMQVIPSTGAQIAETLGWPPEYETRDLYRPQVSVRFGVWYLAQQRDAFDGDLFVALAAYNGGPGNAARWWKAADHDPDVFVELIGFAETRTYVRRIREHYARYRWLYAP